MTSSVLASPPRPSGAALQIGIDPATTAQPDNLDLWRKRLLNWDYNIDFLGRAEHSIVFSEDFETVNDDYLGSNEDNTNVVRGQGNWRYVTTVSDTSKYLIGAGRYSGPAFVIYGILNEISTPISGVNIIDIGCATTSLAIKVRLWNISTRCDLSVSIDGGSESGDHVTTSITLPTSLAATPISIALICNVNSFACALGDSNGENFKIITPWYTVTTFDMASEIIRMGASDGTDLNGGMAFRMMCQSTTAGSAFGLTTKMEWRYWDGVGTRETYLMSNLDGHPIIENGKVWLTTDRTLPYDPSINFLPTGAQVIACQYNPSNGQLGPETSRIFYAKDGRTIQAQNIKIVWDTNTNTFHCFIPDWAKSTGYVAMLYEAVDGNRVDLRYGVHVLNPTALTLPTGTHFTPNTNTSTGDYLYDASLMRIASNDYLLSLSWSVVANSYPTNYCRILLRGTAPNIMTSIVGWDTTSGREGEGTKLVRVGGKLWLICGNVNNPNQYHTWAVVPAATGTNWLNYSSVQTIGGMDWGAGKTLHYPPQIEMFGMPTPEGLMEYHFLQFGLGQFDPTMNATQGSFFAAKSQTFALS